MKWVSHSSNQMINLWRPDCSDLGLLSPHSLDRHHSCSSSPLLTTSFPLMMAIPPRHSATVDDNVGPTCHSVVGSLFPSCMREETIGPTDQVNQLVWQLSPSHSPPRWVCFSAQFSPSRPQLPPPPNKPSDPPECIYFNSLAHRAPPSPSGPLYNSMLTIFTHSSFCDLHLSHPPLAWFLKSNSFRPTDPLWPCPTKEPALHDHQVFSPSVSSSFLTQLSLSTQQWHHTQKAPTTNYQPHSKENWRRATRMDE